MRFQEGDMSPYFLPPHVHVCLVDEGAIFLDLKRDQYIGLSPRQTPLLRALLESKVAAAQDTKDIANGLIEQGLLTRDRNLGKELAATDLERPRTALVTIDMPGEINIEIGHVINFLVAYLRALALLRWRSLEYAVTRVQSRKARRAANARQLDVYAARELVRVFRRLRPFVYGAHRNCLLDSLVLIEFLARYDLYPAWVFAVRTTPFAAHSWVQYGDAVFNDVPQFVGAYTPIASV